MAESLHATGETEVVLDMADTQPIVGAAALQGDVSAWEPRAGTIAEGNDLEALLQGLMARSLPSAVTAAERVISPTDDQDPLDELLIELSLMRQRGPMRSLDGDIQAMLLGGSLFEYSSAARPLPPTAAQRTAIASRASSRAGAGLTLPGAVSPSRSLQLDCSQPSMPGLAAVTMQSLHHSLDRLIEQSGDVDLESLLNGTQSLSEEGRETPGSATEAEIRMLESNLVAVRTNTDDDQARSGPVGGVSTLEAAVSVASEDVGGTPTAPTVMAAAALDSTGSVVSVAGFENPHDMLGGPEPSLAGLAGLAGSAPRSAVGSSVDVDLYNTGESNTAAPTGPDGGLISLLRRLAFSNVEPAALNESLSRSLSRLAQILTTLSGERLSDEQKELCRRFALRAQGNKHVPSAW
eukprot:CAMPEP_0172737980 /NCGR_PEP_ID=MMETSP1074-20121228/119120_1 /TAXON_ID=2916 /ORGANISM="Ceratium fusus, Strain PA161109" /LENGTH=407 /DNA_ID=CAMNT_0013567517 /DNA_START=115 /DNA_END=1336 /DNA_ORIENTATION=+